MVRWSSRDDLGCLKRTGTGQGGDTSTGFTAKLRHVEYVWPTGFEGLAIPGVQGELGGNHRGSARWFPDHRSVDRPPDLRGIPAYRGCAERHRAGGDHGHATGDGPPRPRGLRLWGSPLSRRPATTRSRPGSMSGWMSTSGFRWAASGLSEAAQWRPAMTATDSRSYPQPQAT